MKGDPAVPCRGCPYGRATAPGALRGNDPGRFLGQAVGPFVMPCHQAADRVCWRENFTGPECAGAAMFRDLLGVAERLPVELRRMTGDPLVVFSDPVEYVAYHRACTMQEAWEHIRAAGGFRGLLLRELARIEAGEGQITERRAP